MLADHFPPLGLRLTTPRLELRLPSPEELAELAELAAAGVHEMRAAVLHLAFEGLGAEVASSIAFADNHASPAVSRKLGYRPNGTGRRSVRGRLAIDQRQVLTRVDWEAHRTVPVTIEGLAPAFPLFGGP